MDEKAESGTTSTDAPRVPFDAARLLELFLERGDEQMMVDWRRTGRRFGAIVQSLRVAAHECGLQDRIRVRADRDAEDIHLVRRDPGSPTD